MKRRWLDWPTFVELTEAFTAPMNIAWFAMGASISYYLCGVVNWTNMLLYFVAIIFFDLATNIADNYYDYTHAKDREGYAKHTNVVGTRNLPLRGVWWLGMSLYLISLVPGFTLVARTGWLLVIFGVVGYAAGIFYTAGPYPINATPFGEAVVSLTITYMVQLVCVYVCVFGSYKFDWLLAAQTFMICLPVTVICFTVQLANNVADLDEDIANGRHTLAYFLGPQKSLRLMRYMQAFGALWPLVNFACHLIPWPAALSPLFLPLMWRGMKPFYAKPDKKTTYFPLIKAASIFFIGYTVLLTVGVLL